MKRQQQPMSNRILWLLDILQEKTIKVSYISPQKLLTENRKDIEYRINFLHDVLQKKIKPNQTKYYHFIADKDKGIERDPDEASIEFLKLYDDIKKNGIKHPLIIGEYKTISIKTRHILRGVKFWQNTQNKTGFQLIEGAHRLAISLVLNHQTIPVKSIKAFSFEVPNYTEYLKIKENDYL